MNRRKMLLMAGMGALVSAVPTPLARPDYRTLRVPPDVRLRGSNIVYTTSPLGESWLTYGTTTVWAAMWSVWDWDNWIRPQIDDAAAIGNTVRLWGSTQSFLAGNITEDAYFARWQQMLDYCASKGLYMLPTGSDLATDFQHPISTAKAASHYASWAEMLAAYPGVIGVDLMNEAYWIAHQGRCSWEWLLTTLRSCADAMHSYGLPVAPSFNVWGPSVWSWSAAGPPPAGPIFARYPLAQYFDICDYLDLHIYTDATPNQIAPIYDFPWAMGKPMIFGEFGIADDKPPAARTTFYRMVEKLVSARADNAGALAWTCYDTTNTGLRYGLYSAPGILRADIATPFATFPTTR